MNRAWFEARLRSHFEDSHTDDDPAWYALRNAIYATGARIDVSRKGTFRQAFQTAWLFFSNCLAVHTQLLYFRTSLLAVQALTVMVCFAFYYYAKTPTDYQHRAQGYFSEAIGNPCLEYMLATIAVRLACSKGLHRPMIPSWNMSQEEQICRNNIFWAGYCLEKHCSSRSGRPSVCFFTAPTETIA